MGGATSNIWSPMSARVSREAVSLEEHHANMAVEPLKNKFLEERVVWFGASRVTQELLHPP